MTPDFFAPLEAWRKFSVTDRGRVLKSVGVSGVWPMADPGAAFCQAENWFNPASDAPAHEDPCPSLGCSCGFYAYKTRDDAEKHGQGHILARVEVWGRIAEHERGYRAERVKLKELFLLDSEMYQGDAVALQARYQIPVTTLKGQSAWISESLDASSLSSLSWSPLNYQIGQTITIKMGGSSMITLPAPSPNLHFHPQAFQLVSTGWPVTNYAQIGSDPAGLQNTLTVGNWSDEQQTKPAPRQFFDFSDMKLGSCDDEGLA